MSREGEVWRWSTTVSGLAVLWVLPPHAAGQTPNFWRWSIAPYLWASSIKGRVGVPPLVSDVEQGQGGYALLLEGRPARWRVGVDLVFGERVADSTIIAGGGPLVLNLSQTNLILSPRIGYAVMERPHGSLTLTTALRYWSMDAEITSSLPMSEFRMKGWTKWLDGAFGFEASATPLPRVNLFAQGDLGGGGSRFTWQLWGGIAVDPATCCAVTLSYRHLDVNYQEMVVYDGHLSGPTLGFAFHF